MPVLMMGLNAMSAEKDSLKLKMDSVQMILAELTMSLEYA